MMLDEFLKRRNKVRVFRKSPEGFLRNILQNQPGIACILPKFRGHLLPQRICGMVPGPAQIKCKIGQTSQRLRQMRKQITGCNSHNCL